MRVVVIPVLSDNYSYIVVDHKNNVAVLIDPADPLRVLSAVAEIEDVTATHILTTHKHADHAGGNVGIKDKLPYIQVVGGADDVIPMRTMAVKDNDVILTGDLKITCRHVPCHTKGHMIYHIENAQRTVSALFTGDTMFVAGCGRFFEGSAADMFHAMVGVIDSYPGTTPIYCGHEYTLNNLKFALSLEPSNSALHRRLEWAEGVLSSGGYTVPSLLDDERKTNPFLRVQDPSLQSAVGVTPGPDSAVATMAALRKLKDEFGLGRGKK